MILINVIRFNILVLVQVVVLNQVLINNLLNPQLYILFILLLPFSTRHDVLVLISFLTGLTMDLFSNTAGIHAASCTLIGYLRPYLINLIKPSSEYKMDDQPTIGSMGLQWFLTYAAVLVLLHHFMLFLLGGF